MGGVPGVRDGYSLVAAVGQELAAQAVVLDVVDGLEVGDGAQGGEDMHR